MSANRQILSRQIRAALDAAGKAGPGTDPSHPCVRVTWDGVPVTMPIWRNPETGNYQDPTNVWIRDEDPVLGVYYRNAWNTDRVLIFLPDGSVGEFLDGVLVRSGTWGPC